MSRDSDNQAKAREVILKAENLGVGLAEACDRAGIDRSCPYRWLNGRGARPHTVRRLEIAISEIAGERGTDQAGGHVDAGTAMREIAAIRVSLNKLASAIRRGAKR